MSRLSQFFPGCRRPTLIEAVSFILAFQYALPYSTGHFNNELNISKKLEITNDSQAVDDPIITLYAFFCFCMMATTTKLYYPRVYKKLEGCESVTARGADEAATAPLLTTVETSSATEEKCHGLLRLLYIWDGIYKMYVNTFTLIALLSQWGAESTTAWGVGFFFTPGSFFSFFALAEEKAPISHNPRCSQKFWAGLLTLVFSAGTTATYFLNALDIPVKLKWRDHQAIKFADDSDIIQFSAYIACSAVLFFTNLIVYYPRILKSFCLNSDEEIKPTEQRSAFPGCANRGYSNAGSIAAIVYLVLSQTALSQEIKWGISAPTFVLGFAANFYALWCLAPISKKEAAQQTDMIGQTGPNTEAHRV